MTSPFRSDSTLAGDIAQANADFSVSSDAARARNSANLLKRVRQLHLYLGTLFAPAILFFALTGAAQVFSLHETTRGSDYQPPLLLEKLGQLHKKQNLEVRSKGAAPRIAASQPRAISPPRPASEGRNSPPRTRTGTLLLKWFSFLMSLGLTFTTLLGLYLAFKYNRDRRLIWGLLVAGVVIPVGFLLLQ